MEKGPAPDQVSIDIFCHVVDNFGDLGVTWRLARQLAAEKNCAVRLIVDDFEPFRAIAPDLDIAKDAQEVAGVTVLRWDDTALPRDYTAPAPVVIEAFACTLPGFVMDLMVQHKTPVWIDLEYLSAEGWVEDCHAVPSFHPATGLTKTLFFPGFTARTGGLIREEKLLHQRDGFQGSVAAQNEWRVQHGLPPIVQETLDISLFCYKYAPVDALLTALENTPARVFVPEKIAAQLLQHYAGPVEIHPFAYLPQDDYDRLLWTCNLNFVRGEDSFIRALWAGRPFIWQIYPQDEDAHLVKLDAFFGVYSRNLAPDGAETLADFTGMWNLRGHNTKTDAFIAERFFKNLPTLNDDARQRADEQAEQDNLATQLIRFIETQIRK